jgi:chromosomal replication initiator protein
MRHIDIPDDVASYVASKLDANIRQLEGVITKLQSMSLLDNTTIDLPMAKKALGNSASKNKPKHISIQDIFDLVTVFYDVKLSDLLSKKRHKSVTIPRQVGMWIARKHTRFSLEEIGGYFGGRDHTTVMHAIKAVDKKRLADDAFDHDITQLVGQLSDQSAA